MLSATTAFVAGAALAAALCVSSTAVVAYVARHLPHLSLMVALLSYTLQTVAVVAALSEVADAGVRVSGWFAAGVIAVALVWTVGALVRHQRSRIPAFDLAEPVGRR